MPQEYRLILKHIDQPGYTPDIECYLRHGGYEALKKALACSPRTLPTAKPSPPRTDPRRGEEIRSARSRRRGFFVRAEVVFRGSQERQADLPDLQRGRIGAGHVQGPADHHKDPHQMIEGMIISCYANDVKLAYIYIRGEFPWKARASEPRAGKEARAKNFLGQEHPRAAATTWRFTCTAARALTSAARKPG
jgi:NADH-quinone oxidoreductase subunit F